MEYRPRPQHNTTLHVQSNCTAPSLPPPVKPARARPAAGYRGADQAGFGRGRRTLCGATGAFLKSSISIEF